MGLFGKETKSGKTDWLTGNLDRRVAGNRGIEGAMRNLGNKAADSVAKSVVDAVAGSSHNSSTGAMTEQEKEKQRERQAKRLEDDLIRRRIVREKRLSEKNKGNQIKAEGKKWLGLWISGGKNFRVLFYIFLPLIWMTAWGRDFSVSTLLLYLLAFLGTFYAVLVIKDALK